MTTIRVRLITNLKSIRVAFSLDAIVSSLLTGFPSHEN